MTQSRIDKLRELAERGVGGEMENAKAILTRLGINWRKPKNSFSDRVKKTFGGNVVRTYAYKIEYASDLLLLWLLMEEFNVIPKLTIINAKVHFECEQHQFEDISRIMRKHRKQFNSSMYREAKQYINVYLNADK